ncbi:PH domain-containing protein [Listeria seeligeri]|uniref:PH domain-containing protein n=1 Tax=Listeria seeligeri TaxID=1640 RepID=UPI0010DB842D|nr:PH domain-containing protein [Listeria seeligeri]MBC1424221.1 PH domain-containing protein [Listeria seeligeri]MBC1430573.1 PH domain-containing protein [Listeria seeligeri]MBC1472548.1 PH domain-containing protein [Listeria seeligeri]MBC1479813.1 PH domain-containing protein [Listeria seeligeri]MBC1528093.1 PH domain-containing protein [Listeria seeligeri]
MLDKLMGKASVVTKSSYGIERFLDEGEEVIRVFKFVRDELIITSKGIFNVDAQGITGKKVEYKFFPLKALKYVSIETAGTLDRDFDLKIGVEGNTVVVQNTSFSAPLTLKVHKNDTEMGMELYKIIKGML